MRESSQQQPREDVQPLKVRVLERHDVAQEGVKAHERRQVAPELFLLVFWQSLEPLHRRIDVLVEKTRRIIEAAKNKIDFLWMGEDLGTQIAPLISPELFRKHIRPRHQKIVDMAKSFGLPVMIHSCGSSSWAFNDFIEMGIDAVDTLQPEAANMNPEYLKKSFGDRLVFHGCISTAGSLAYGTAADVTEDVRKTLEIMMPGGGYCLAPTHMIQDNSPTENVAAMYAMAHKYGHYR